MIKPKQWQIGSREDDQGAVAAIAGQLGVGFPTALLLYQRGYRTAEAASAFIRLEAEMLRDPFLMTDMEAACERVLLALERQEQIGVYGDYDVDGVTATSLLCLYLRACGALVDYYIPNRVGEGYGVNCEAVRALTAEGFTLLITVDTGITAVEEVAYASSCGCDTIVTDHHECHGDLPHAVAVINPRRPDCPYPFKELAGVGVAFKLVTALEYMRRKRYGQPIDGFLSEICRSYIDLVALGTVADVMPLHDENRLIVSMGLRSMERATRPGIRALLDAAEGGKAKSKKRMTSSVIGFALAPRINAAGRIRSASRAVELFLSESEDEAARIANDLCDINRQRQAEENKIMEQVEALMETDPALSEASVIVLAGEDWNSGVIGIVSSRITEKYGKPSILISFDGERGKGSGRSIKGLNLVEALMDSSDLLEKFGGHELAAGLSIAREKLSLFRERINAYAKAQMGDRETAVPLDIDFELQPAEISLRQAEELELLEPCGTGNPVPLFAMKGLSVREVVPLGLHHHSKLLLERDGYRFSAVCFGSSPEDLGFAPSDICDIAFNLNVNEFMGNRTEQLVVRDVRFSEDRLLLLEQERDRYLAACGEGLSLTEGELPKREDFVSVYLHLKRSCQSGERVICLHTLLHALNETPGVAGPMTYLRLRFVLDILAETGIITCNEKDLSRPGRECFAVVIHHLEQKVNLETSCIYKHLLNLTTTLPVS